MAAHTTNPPAQTPPLDGRRADDGLLLVYGVLAITFLLLSPLIFGF